MKTSEEAAAEIQNRRKKRVIKVAITEGLMVVAVLALVVVMTLFAVGYNVDPEEGTVEKTGLVLIQSQPTGANVTYDGNNIFGWTNLSQSMNEGEHTISISKDGYDTWTKNISVTAGLYYRLNYPRLFLSEKTTEEIADFSEVRLTSFAKDGNLMLVVPENSATWQLWKVNNDKPTKTELNLAEAFPNLTEETLNGEIEIKGWSGNSERVLLTVSDQWLLLDVKKVTDSVNLTERFGVTFSDIKIANDAASELFALENGNLRTIDINDDKISGVLVSNVQQINNLKTDLVYTTAVDTTGELTIGMYRKGEKGGTVLSTIVLEEGQASPNLLATLGEYYGEYYVTIVSDNIFEILKSETLPSYGNESEFKTILLEELDFVPEKLEVTGGGEFYTAVNGLERAVFDVETTSVKSWVMETEMAWLDEYMLYGVSEEGLIVMDFDSENRRVLTADVTLDTVAKISKNNKWLYYLNSEQKLMRIIISK